MADIEAQFADRPCGICGKWADDCECLECPTCQAQGCVEHLPIQSLVGTLDRYQYVVSVLQAELTKREAALAVKCRKCGKMCPADLREGMTYCESCEDFA